MEEAQCAETKFIFNLNCIQAPVTKDADAPLTQQKNQQTIGSNASRKASALHS
jgi:hypothetical protein